MKRHSGEPSGPTEQTHRVGDQNNYRNSPLSDFPRMIDPTGGYQGADSPEESDSPEEEDTQAVEEYHLEDHQEAVGDHHCYQCHKPTKGSW